MTDSLLFATQRTKLLGVYEEAGQPFRASTLPYHSVRSLKLEVIHADTTNGVAVAVARANQRLDFFGYGVGERIPLGPQTDFQATEAETNLAKAKSTNGSSDFVIEGVAMNCRGMTIDYGTASTIPSVSWSDPDANGALLGKVPLCDPASIVMVPQGQSPFNLENAIFHAVTPYLSLEFEWDRKRTEKIGVCDLLPQGGAASHLRSNGTPESDNRYAIPEGYLWRRDGEPDSEFVARARLERPIVVPINLRQQIGGLDYRAPVAIYLELVMRVYGLEVSLPSSN